ncbi:hypothetical protein ACP275_10G176100 [Erythranthe tilingii]
MCFIAWTTKPSTLPSNSAHCIIANIVYGKVRKKFSGKVYVAAETRLMMSVMLSADNKVKARFELSVAALLADIVLCPDVDWKGCV